MLVAWDEIKISRSLGLTTKGSKDMREFFFLASIRTSSFPFLLIYLDQQTSTFLFHI